MLCSEGTDIWNKSELNLQPLVRVTRRLFRPSFNLLDGRTIASSAERQNQQIAERDQIIEDMRERLLAVEAEADRHEQYTRRPNIRIQGIPQAGEGSTDDKVMELVNVTMALVPPLQLDDIERSRRLGPPTDKEGRPRTRPIIVRFRSERIRDTVYRARLKLKDHNREHPGNQIFINEDLTARRALLAYETRQMKKNRQINDCWTADGRIMVKDLKNNIVQVTSINGLKKVTK